MQCNVSQTQSAKRIRQIDILILIVLFGVSIFAIIKYNYFNEEIGREIGRFGLIGVFIATALLEFIPQILHPFVSVIVATEIGINIWIATFVAAIASTVGSVLGYLVGHKYGFGIVCQLFKQKTINKVLTLWQRYGKEFVFISALTPIPYFPLIFGALGLKKRQMILWGLIPRFLAYITFAWMYYYWLKLI